jgi:hypothetical protein
LAARSSYGKIVAACWSSNLRVSGLATAIFLALTACGGGESAPPAAALVSARPVDYSDVEIAQLLYADNHRTPQGFYQDPIPAVPGYIATSHLKNTDLPANAATTQYELCTDDWNSALTWSDQVSAATSGSVLNDTITTTRYFEFGRTQSTTPPGYLRMRVYRCDYLDRSDVDLRSASGVAGLFNQRPITASNLQQLAEYLWQFTSYNNYGNAVLKSSGAVVSAGFQHTLIIATLTAATNGSTCDRVNVMNWTHTVDAQTGALTLTTQSLWSFGSQNAAGVVDICDPGQ